MLSDISNNNEVHVFFQKDEVDDVPRGCQNWNYLYRFILHT